jgi:hypothetical protein
MSQNEHIKKLESKLNDVNGTIEEFEVNPIIIEYKKLLLEKKQLENEITAQTCQIELGRIKKCQHYILAQYNLFKPSIKYCIKCGLSTDVLTSYREELNELGRVRYDYLTETGLIGINNGYCCDPDLANEIYTRIKKANPGIDEKTAIKYFEIALDNMMSIKVHNERIRSRAKRLDVNPSSIISMYKK